MKAGYEEYLKRRKDNPNLRLGSQGYEKDENMIFLEAWFIAKKMMILNLFP